MKIFSISSGLTAAMLCLATALTQAQSITVEGIADRTIYTDSARFRVPVVTGFTYRVWLDGQPVPAGVTNLVTKMDYHEVFISRTNTASSAETNHLVRFIVVSSQRGPPETGLMMWTPYPPIPSTAGELAGARMRLVVPQAYPLGLPIPVVVWLEDEQGGARRANGYVTAPGFENNPVQIFRGVGSGMLPPAVAAGPLDYNATLPGLQTNKQITIEGSTTWTTRSGVLTVSEVWPVNSRIHLTAGLTVPTGLSLTIGAGTVVKLNPLVNITNSGQLVIDGKEEQPVIFTATNIVWPERNSGAWGGIIMRGIPTNLPILEMTGTIFTGGGGGTGWSFPPPSTSHKSQQPVILLSNAVARLTNSAIISTAGQVGNGYNGDLTLDHTLCQRAVTCGEYVGGTVIINHSAIIEFPNDNGIVDATIADADYDGIYFTTGTHILMNSLLGFAKDDAIDSGSGGAGTMWVTNCWVESALHEAHAWSGGGRVASSYDTVLINSGQGLECGWSTGTDSPRVFAERLLTTGNSVGARFGDNYTSIGSGFNGSLRVTNSLILHNYRDVFLKTWNNPGTGWQTNSWVDRLQQSDLRSNLLTAADSRFPSNQVWNPADDGWRLAHWMTTPPGAPVGIGLAVRTNQFALPTLLDGVPVRLSSFTTNFVSVDYHFAGTNGPLGAGTLTFAPGETVKRFYPTFSLRGLSWVRATLSGPINGELTGETNALFIGSTPAPVLFLPVLGTQMDLARIGEGVPVQLSAPASGVSVDYRFEGAGRELASGTLVFAPGQLVQWAFAPGLSPATIDLVRFSLSHPTNALLGSPSNLFLVPMPGATTLPEVTFVNWGARWLYLDNGVDQGTNWRSRVFDTSSWSNGLAQLGFGDSPRDETTLISRTNSQGQTNITFYFRHTFPLSDPTNYESLNLSLLRDDAGVVYLNGQEVLRSPNLPQPPAVISYGTFANATGENTTDTRTLGAATNLVTGDNAVAVEIHQERLTSSDVSFDLQLQGTPKPTALPSQRVYLGQFGGQYTLVWADPSYLLEEADAVNGPWSPVPGANSPYLMTPLAVGNRFYRLFRP